MATSILSKYRSLSRPSIGKSSSSGTFSTYAKQQLAAEDKIIDLQYESGTLSPEAYLSNLQVRSARTGITPLTQVNLQEKIRGVQEKISDATVSQQYQAGKLSTSEVLEYEKQKLARMTEPGSAAYIQQSQKIQQLTDKAEKESRASFRTQEMLRIAQMPDDSSERAWEKARLYQQLSEQARLDGDTQQADQLATQAINYTGAAKKADINDLITQTRLQVSETAGAGLGTPSSEGGLSRITGEGSIQGGVTGGVGPQEAGLTATPSVATGYSGVKNTAVNNALESLDRQYKSYERTAQQLEDTNALIARYQEIIPQAEGDQKTQLTIALNNLLESKRTKENQLGIIESGIGDSVARIQEAQTKAAASAFNQEARKYNQQFDKAETDLETAFAKGEITKEEYIQKGEALAATKTQFYSQASDVFNQYGNDSSAESYLQKAAQMEEIHQGLISVAENLDDYEPIMADPTGKITNLLGKAVKPGEISLTNVRQLKDSGDFESNYTYDNGVYKRVFYPGVKGDLDGGYVSKGLAEALAKEATAPEKAPFVYGKETAPGGIGPVRGTINKQPLTKTATGQWVTPNTFDTMKKTANESLDKVIGKTSKTQQLIDQTKESISGPQVKQPSFLDRVLNPSSQLTAAQPKQNMITSAISSAKDSVGDWFGNAVSGVKKLFNSARDKIAGATKNVNLPPLVPKAVAAESTSIPSGSQDIESIIKSVFPKEQWGNAMKVAMGESSMNPSAVNTGNRNKSVDYGLFQINSIHLPWIKQKYGWTEKDLSDPVKNTIIAKEVYDRSKGWSPWVAANKQGIVGYTPAPTPKPEDVMSRLPSPSVAGASTSRVVPSGNVISESTKTPTTQSYRAISPVLPKLADSVTPSYIPPERRIGSQLIDPATQDYNYIAGIKVPKKIELPKINLQPAIQKVQQVASPIIQKVQQAAKPVTNVVSKAVSSVKNLLGNIFKRK